MPIKGAFIVPHPPIILPEVGRGREREIQSTIDSYAEIARRIAGLKPQTIVLSSPHSVMYADYFHISPGKSARGDMRQFGAPSAVFNVEYDAEFVSKLASLAGNEGIPAGTLGQKDASLDHGTIVPLAFIEKRYRDFKLVRIGLSGLPYAEHYRLGMCVLKAARELERDVVFVASGDMSHKVASDGPYGFAQEGVDFDRQVTGMMAEGDFLSMLNIPPEFADKAAECGLRSFIIMAGALDGMAVEPELLSYEGTFGVGYGIASFMPKGESADRHILEKYYAAENERLQKIKDEEDEYVRLARHSVETYVKTGRRAQLPEDVPEELLNSRAGVFVSLKKQGNLRGCIGTVGPTAGSIAEEIMNNAVSACAHDPRFDPVTPKELPQLVYDVDVLFPPEKIDSPTELDVKRYGVIVTSGHKRGLLLPDLEGVDTVRQQIDIALQKAGIRPGEKYTLERFMVVRHV